MGMYRMAMISDLRQAIDDFYLKDTTESGHAMCLEHKHVVRAASACLRTGNISPAAIFCTDCSR